MRRAVLSLGLGIAVVAGCGPYAVAPPGGPSAAPRRAPSSPSRPKAGYERRVDDLASVDAGALAGKRIALDPGHGGFFRGALGVKGLTEAEVNLGVALNLRGLLEARGAIVLMTRTDDRDFLTPGDSSLRADLTERMRIANAFAPDLFLSIHHNADARGAHDVNETQTYYKLGDEGPSLDLAQGVHRYLVRNLGIERHRVVPGNYFVLRTAEPPAILTESSYITNPDVESRLALAASQRLEAEALLLGIARYCARRAPQVEEFRAWFPGLPRARSPFATAWPELRARIRGAFDEARMTLDGVEIEPLREGGTLSWRPPAPLAMGQHVATLDVRLAGEGSARTAADTFEVRNAPHAIVAEFPDQVSWDGRQPLGLRVRVLDRDGLADPDTLRLRVRDDGTRLLAPGDTVVTLREGVAWVYFRRSAQRPADRAPEVRVRLGLTPPPAGESVVANVPPAAARLAFLPARRPATRTAFALEMPDEAPLRDAPGTREPGPRITWLNRDGFVRVRDDSAAGTPRSMGTPRSSAIPALDGYRPWASESTWPPRLVAIAGGALHGRRIVIDPDGGGDVTGGEGPGGTRAASLNLEVARALASMLGAAGAEVLITRAGDFALSDVERVQISERFHPERFLRIGHRDEPPMFGYYFSSAAGHAWAARVAESFGSLGLSAPPLAEDAQYPLQQTSCPALYVSPARIDGGGEEERLLAPGVVRAEAYALYLGFAREWAPEQAFPPDSIEVRDESGYAVAGAMVTLGGALVLESDARGVVRFARTEPGPLEASVLDPRVSARALLLDSERGVILTGPSGR